MATTTPNKEAIRRICILNKASYCYLLVSSDHEEVLLLLDVDIEQVTSIERELLTWCGMNFRVFTPTPITELSNMIISKGEKILPINETR